jgi:hypothetical protein
MSPTSLTASPESVKIINAIDDKAVTTIESKEVERYICHDLSLGCVGCILIPTKQNQSLPGDSFHYFEAYFP